MKRKHLLILILSLLSIMTLFLLPGCMEYINYLIDRTGSLESDYDPKENIIPEDDRKKLDEASAEAEEEIQEEELSEGFEDYPGIITLKDSIWDDSVLTLIINMDTQEVEGSVVYGSSIESYDGKITKGKIDLDTFEITAHCCGPWKDKEYKDRSGEECLDIKGQLAKDFEWASGMAVLWTGTMEWDTQRVD